MEQHSKSEISPRPISVPSLTEIRLKLFLLSLQRKNSIPSVEDFLLSQQRNTLLASDVARYGKYNWDHIRHETAKKPKGKVAEYLQSLMRFMLDQKAYTKKMKAIPSENMSVNNDWSVAFNGNHRVLALRILGEKKVQAAGINRWVRIHHL